MMVSSELFTLCTGARGMLGGALRLSAPFSVPPLPCSAATSLTLHRGAVGGAAGTPNVEGSAPVARTPAVHSAAAALLAALPPPT